MSDEEIFRILKNAKGNVCGRFNNSQLNRAIISYERSVPGSLKVAAMAAGLALLGSQVDAQQLHRDIRTEIREETKNDSLDISFHDNPEQDFKTDTTLIIKGKITDATTGEPLPFVVVSLFREGKSIAGCYSDVDGNYRMEIKELLKEDSIKASYVGYKTMKVGIENNDLPNFDINLKMEGNIQGLISVGLLIYSRPFDEPGTTTYKFDSHSIRY